MADGQKTRNAEGGKEGEREGEHAQQHARKMPLFTVAQEGARRGEEGKEGARAEEHGNCADNEIGGDT